MPGLDDADSLEELILDLSRNDPEEKKLFLFSVYVEEVLQDAGELHELVEAFQRNTTVQEVFVGYEVGLHLDDDDDEEFVNVVTERWCTLLRAVGTLPALRNIELGDCWGYEGAFEATLAMLQCATQLTTLYFAGQIESEEDLRAFSSCLRSLPALEKVELSWFSPDSIGPILEALAMLPKIRDVRIDRRLGPNDASFIQRSPFSHVLRAPSLNSLMLRGYQLEEPDLQVIYRYAMHGHVKKLHFYDCSFPAGAEERMAAELQTSTTLEDFGIVGKRETCLGRAFLLPIMRVLRTHPTTWKLMLGDEFSDEALCDDLAELIGKSASLSELTIDGDSLSDNALQRILPALKATSSLKTLLVLGDSMRCGSTVTETGKALVNKNSTLQSLGLYVSPNHLAAFIGSLGRDNTTLSHIDLSEKALRFFHIESWPVVFELNDEESDALVKAAKKNYGLEHIAADFECQTLKRQLDIIFALNKAGRKYLQEDPPSKEKGVRVLSNFSEDLDCIFFHLLENPSLCKCEESSKCKGGIDSSSSHVGRKRKARVMDQDV